MKCVKKSNFALKLVYDKNTVYLCLSDIKTLLMFQ